MGTRLGFKPGGINITITDSGRGHRGEASTQFFDELKSVDETILYIRRRLMVLYSGVLAEALKADGTIDDAYAVKQLEHPLGGAKDDASKIRELLRILRSLSCPNPLDEENHKTQLKNLQNDLWGKAHQFTIDDSKLITGVTGAVMQRAKFLDEEFGMKGNELLAIPNVKKWLDAIEADANRFDV